MSLWVVPVMAGGGCGASGADRRGSGLHIHPTAKEFQIHVHLQNVNTKLLQLCLRRGYYRKLKWKISKFTTRTLKTNKTIITLIWESHTHTLQYLAGGRLHHAVVGAHDASVWIGDRGLSVDVGGLHLGRSGRQRQEGLTSTRAKVWQGQLGAGQRDGHLETD